MLSRSLFSHNSHLGCLKPKKVFSLSVSLHMHVPNEDLIREISMELWPLPHQRMKCPTNLID